MRYLSALFILLAAMLVTSCKPNVLKGSGNKATINATTASFNAVHVDLPLKVEVTVQEGAQPGIKIDGYENVLAHIKTKVENNTLVLYTELDDTWEIDGDGIHVHITAPTLVALKLKGAPDAHIHGNVAGSALKVDASGASEIVVDSVTTDTLMIHVSGAADLKVKGGSVKYAAYKINGAGDVIAFPLQTNETVATISGAGGVEVSAAQKLTVYISGAGTIKYKGHPVIKQEISGAGTIKDAN